MTGGRRAWVAVGLVAAALVAVAGRADAAVYWTSSGDVVRANNDGTLLDEHFIEPNWSRSPAPSGSPAGVLGCAGIAVDGSHLYWADPSHGSIDHADLDGGNVDYYFVTGLQNPCGVAVDGSHVYWADPEAGTIGIANLDGGEAQREFMTGVGEPCGVAVGDGYLYWSTRVTYQEMQEAEEGVRLEDYVARVPVGGGIREKLFEGESLCGVALDATHVYWGGFGTTIGRAGLDGSEPEPSFISGVDRPCGVALYGSDVYWSRNDPPSVAIMATSVNAPGSIRTVASGTLGLPCGVAVDSVQIQPPAPPPSLPAGPRLSHEFSFGPPRHGKGLGTVFIAVTFPQAGEFRVKGSPGVRVRVFPHGPSRRTRKLVAPEKRLLKIWPARRGPVAKALRERLRTRGRAKVSVRIRYYAADHTISVRREPLSLTDRRHRRRAGRT